MKPTDFWPIVAICDRCGHEVAEEDAVAVVTAGVWAGFQHEGECPDDDVTV